MKRLLASLLRDTRGATAIEYGMICALIVLVVVVGIRGLAGENGGTWGNISTKTISAMSAA